MLGIRRQDAGAGPGGALHEEVAGTDQAFLVGQRDGGAAIDGRQRRLQPGRARYRGHQPVRRALRGLDDGAVAGAALDAGAGQRRAQFGEPGRIGNRDEAGAEFLGEFHQAFDVGVGGQRLHLIALGRGADQVHRAVTDRAGGAENGDAAHTGRGGLVVSQGNSTHRITKP